MESELKKAKIRQKKRLARVRKKVVRSKLMRLSINRSLKNVSGQIIDDREGKTIVGVSTLNKQVKPIASKEERAAKAGQMIAELALENGITKVVFDRGHYKFHGLIAAFADSARKAGLVF